METCEIWQPAPRGVGDIAVALLALLLQQYCCLHSRLWLNYATDVVLVFFNTLSNVRETKNYVSAESVFFE